MEQKKGGPKKLRARFETSKKQLEKVKKEGADVTLALSLLAEADKLVRADDEAESTKILDNIDLMLSQAKSRKKYEMMIFNSMPIIERAKRAGANVSVPERLLAKAEELLEAGDFGAAHEQIKLARREADNAKHFMTAKGHIQRVTPLVEAAKRKGVSVNEATKTIIEAWQALDNGNFDLVTELARRTSTLLGIAEEQKGYEISIGDMEARIAAVAESGVDTKEMSALLAEAKDALGKEEFGTVRTVVNRIRREIERVILRREADLTLRTIRQFVRETKRVGISSDELEHMLEKASVALHGGDFAQVRAMELSAKQAVKNLKLFDRLVALDVSSFDKDQEEGFVTLLREELAEYRHQAERARAGGIDVAEIDRLIGEAERSLNAGGLNDAFDSARMIKRLVSDRSSGFGSLEAKNRLDDIISAIEEAKTIGIDVAEAEALAMQAKAGDGLQDATDIVDKAAVALNGAVKGVAAGKHPRLKVKVSSDGLEAQKWGRASIELNNVGNSIAKNIDINFYGELEVKGWQMIPRLVPGQRDSREIAVKPTKPGKLPLDMTVNYAKSFDDTKFQLNDLEEVDVTEAGTFLVEDAFLIHNNGLLISKQTRRIKEVVDGDLFSAMLTAISQFAMESFNREEKVALSRLEFGDNQVLIERGSCFFVAATLIGSDSAYMPFYISEIVAELEGAFGDRLSAWDGDMGALAGIDDLVRKILLIRNGEGGIPISEGSILRPALEAATEGKWAPDFDREITELLISFEEELISGEIGETGELMGRIREIVGEAMGKEAFTDVPSDRKDSMLMDSMMCEVELIRRQIDSAAALGADVSEEKRHLLESLTSLERKDFQNARGSLGKITDLLAERERQIAAGTLAKQLESVKAGVNMAGRMGVAVSDMESKITEAEKLAAEDRAVDIGPMFESIRMELDQRTGAFMANKYPKLQIEVSGAGGHEAGRWSTMDVVVTNRGNTPARNVGLNFGGDLEAKTPEALDLIEPNCTRTVGVPVKPAKTGALHVDVSATYQRYFDDTLYQLNDMKGIEAKSPGSYIVEDAFLIHNNGLMISRETRRIREDIDGDLFSAMLKALTDFIREAFNVRDSGGLDRMEFGGRKLLIEKGRYIFLAITVAGEESAYLPFYMTEIIREIEVKYSGALENWDGEMAELDGIGEIVRRMVFVNRPDGQEIPFLESSVLAPVLEKGAGGGAEGEGLAGIREKIADLNRVIEGEGFEAAARYIAEMEAMVSRLTSIPETGVKGAVGIDKDVLKRRMYDIMIRSGGADRDSALMDARLNNYLEVVGLISDAVFRLRESNGIQPGVRLARVAVRHPDSQRWGEVFENMRSLLLEQANAADIELIGPEDVWSGLVPEVKVDEEHIRGSYKHLAKKIISVLQYMPPDKLLANLRRGTFTIGVEGQQVYISSEMIQISFSLPQGAFEGPVDAGTLYIDTVLTDKIKSDTSVAVLIDTIRQMRHELEIEEGAKIEVQILAPDALAEALESSKEVIIEKCGAYDAAFPLDDPFGGDEYYVKEVDLNGEKCRVGIVQVDFED